MAEMCERRVDESRGQLARQDAVVLTKDYTALSLADVETELGGHDAARITMVSPFVSFIPGFPVSSTATSARS